MSRPQTSEDYRRYIQEKGDPRLRKLSGIIHGLNRKNDMLYWQIEKAKKAHLPWKSINKLVHARRKVLQQIQSCKDERNAIRRSLSSTDHKLNGSTHHRERLRHTTHPTDLT